MLNLKRKITRLLAANPALARQVRAYLDRREKISAKEWRTKVLPTLKSVENDILTRIRTYSLSDWQLSNLNNILGQVQGIINSFAPTYTDSVLASQDALIDFSVASMNKEIATIGLTAPLNPVLTEDILAILEPLTTVFTNVFSVDLSKIVKAEITTGLVNGEGTMVVAKRIRDNFGNTSERIKFLNKQKATLQQDFDAGRISKTQYEKKLTKINKQLEKGSMMSFARAQRIAMTEMNRAASFSRQLRTKEIAAVNPQAKRIWINLHKPGARGAHISVENTTKAKPIGLNEQFSVNGNPADYPLDPALPVGEVVNCGCTTVIVNPKDFSDLGTLSKENITPKRILDET